MGMERCSLSLYFPTQSANATEERYLAFPHRGTWRLTGCQFAPATAVAAAATDYLTATVTKNDGAAGSDSASLATFNTDTGQTALVLKTTLDLTLTQITDFTRGQQIKVAKTLAGAGKILDGDWTFEFEKIN